MWNWVFRKIDGVFDRHRAITLIKWPMIFFIVILVYAIAHKLAMYYFPDIIHEPYNWYYYLNVTDSAFSVGMSILTVLGLLLAFFAIKGLFERIRNFEILLETSSTTLKEIKEDETIKIVCYYPSFGIVTLGDTESFRAYTDTLFHCSGNGREIQVLTEDVQTREETLEQYCQNYGFSPEALQLVVDKIGPGAKSDPYYSLLLQLPIQKIKDDSQSHRSRALAGLIFNLYNEYLLIHIDASVKTLGKSDMPDYHMLFSSSGPGVIFVPLLIPEAARTGDGGVAEIVGWRTVDRKLIKQMNDNFEHYWKHKNASTWSSDKGVDFLQNQIGRLRVNFPK